VIGRPPFETPDVKSTYKKIKMCVFSFPEHIPISENVRNIISNILQLDPAKRPTLDQLLEHPFINHGKNIPKFLPLSTLACPPSKNYLNQFTGLERDEKNTSGPKDDKNDIDIPDFGELKSKGIETQQIQDDPVKREMNGKGQNKDDIYVVKWVDYSSKYGLGYLLSNNCSGVFFNDCTKVIIDPKTE